MSEIETATRIIVGLLVRGQYDVAERVTRGCRIPAADMERAITEYGRTLVPPGEGWWSTVSVVQVDSPENRRIFNVVAPLWTCEEGMSDLSVELELTETAKHYFEIQLLDIHVL